MNNRRYKTASDGIIGTFPFIYSLVSRTRTVSIFGRPNENQPIKEVGIANLIVVYFPQGNHGNGSHPYEDIKVFKKHQVSDHLYTIL